MNLATLVTNIPILLLSWIVAHCQTVLFVLNITIIIHIKMCEKRAIWHKKYSLDLQRIQRFIKPPHWWTHVLHSCWELAKICPHSNNQVINSHIPQETFSKRNFRDTVMANTTVSKWPEITKHCRNRPHKKFKV